MTNGGTFPVAPIAITGMACRLPGAAGPDAFWTLLCEGRDVTDAVPSDRWDAEALFDPDAATRGRINSKRGSFIADLDRFDAGFFGIYPHEACRMDPLQKLALEVSWEALEHAGLVPSQLAEKDVGVYMGVSHSDHGRKLHADIASMDGQDGTNCYLGFVAHRVSYLLNLQGPSMGVDTACSSSLVAVHLACQALRNRECDLALGGGVNVNLLPSEAIAASVGGMLSADGRCKTFDQSADGFGRGEGCGVVVLQRLSDAMAQGANILAVIRGSAVNHNGLSNGITAPSGRAQQAVIRRALAVADVAAAEIGYVEAHGTGTLLGDALELRALQQVLGSGGERTTACRVGAVKTNMGHLEAASGIAGLIKVVLMLQHRQIPPHLNLRTVNQHISLDKSPIALPTELEPWAASASGRRAAGVSAFGFGGTNCHIVVAEGPIAPAPRNDRERPVHILIVRAKTETALRAVARTYLDFITDNPGTGLGDLCFSANTGRSDFPHRLAIAVRTLDEARLHLAAFVAQTPHQHSFAGRADGRKRPNLAFLFDGACCDIAAAATFYETSPIFRAAFDDCATAFGFDVAGVLGGSTGGVEKSQNDTDDEILSVAAQYALSELWLAWVAGPKMLLAHGIGKLAAACAARVLDLPTAGRLLAARKRRRSADGLAVGHDLDIICGKPRWPIVDTDDGVALGAAMTDPGYWTRFIGVAAAPVGEPVSRRQPDGHTVVVFGQENAFGLAAGFGVGRSAWQAACAALCRLAVAGTPVDWSGFDRFYARSRIALPTYPFERLRFWFEPETVTHDAALSGRAVPGSAGSNAATRSVSLSREPDAKISTERLQGRLRQADPVVPTRSNEVRAGDTARRACPPIARSRLEIEQWTRRWLGERLELDPDAVDADKEFTQFGINSVIAMRFLRELGDWLGTSLAPSVVWKYRTIRSLSAFLIGVPRAPDDDVETMGDAKLPMVEGAL
jgi:acyl transferase domain-containing protein